MRDDRADPSDEPTTTIRLLREADADAYATLRRRSLLDSPLAFLSSPEDDPARDREALRVRLRQAPDFAVIGAFRDDLVGAVGLYRDSHRKGAHKVHLWGMYVAPDHRRQGIARELLEAAVRHAVSLGGVSWVHLGVSSAAPEAFELYRRAGFEVWGTEPEALRHEGRAVGERRMALQLGVPIVDYDRSWPRRFTSERRALAELFRGTGAVIEHIGGTSVPGLGGRPILDIMIGLDRIETAETRALALMRAGYDYVPEDEEGLPEGRGFRKPRARPRTHHLYLVPVVSRFWHEGLAIRDYLRGHQQAVDEYYALKQRLSTTHRSREYREGKGRFVREILRRTGRSG